MRESGSIIQPRLRPGTGPPADGSGRRTISSGMPDEILMKNRFTTASLAAATVVLLATGAAAQPRPSILAMSCGQARALVASRGAIVLGTGPHTYDRYVAHTGFCPHDQTTEPAFEPTRDNPQCYIGNRCIARRSEQPTGDSGGGGGGGGMN